MSHRSRLATALAIPALFLSGAASASDELTRAAACAALEADKARLACFDAIFMSAADAIAPALLSDSEAAEDGEEKFGLSSPPVATKAEEFGAENLPKAADASAEISEIHSGVTENATTHNGRIIVVLDNGQVWRQLDSDGVNIRIPKKLQPTVTIKKTAFGYRMTINELKRTIRVRRIK